MRRVALRLIATAATTALLVACNTDGAVSTDPVGPPAYGVSLTPVGTNIPRGTARFVFPRSPADTVGDTLHVSIAGLDSLTDSYYVVWVGDSAGSSFHRLTGTAVVTVTDTTLNAQGDPAPDSVQQTYPGTSAFQFGGPRTRVDFTATRASAGLSASDSLQVLLVTIETDPNPAAPSASRRPLWAARGELSSVPATGTAYRAGKLNFGHYDPSAAAQYRFVPSGRGKVQVRGTVLIVNDSSLSRPPLGYYYAVFAVKRDTAKNPIDTLYFGPETSPFPRRDISLYDADSVTVDPLAQPSSPQEILAAAVRLDADTVAGLQGQAQPYRGYAQLYVTLESKSATPGRMGPAVILAADLPDAIRVGSP